MHVQIRGRRPKDDASGPEVRFRWARSVVPRALTRLPARKVLKRLYWAVEGVGLVGAVGAAALISRADEWHPLVLVGLLFALALLGHWLSVTFRTVNLSASLVALVLGMSLLGPAPAVAFGIAAMILTSALRRLPASQWLNNLATYAIFPLAGGLMVRALAGNVHDPHNQHMTQSVTFGLVVMAMFLVTVALNFALVAVDVWMDEGRSLLRQARETFIPLLSGQLSTGALATILAIAYLNTGLPVLLASIAVLVIFQQLTVALLRSEDRADQLEARTIHLVSLQLGVLRTLVRALGMRDETTARHSAAVARYAQELAREVGSSKDDQDTVHTAGLLHDIGKFTWPDRVLHGDVTGAADEQIVKRHPREGAELVGALDGYGPVADAILYHHERVDGGGYPAGLIGKEIPLTSRILAICCIYDTMTQRGTYRPTMTAEEAIAELRLAAGHGQLDAELVESFIGLLQSGRPLLDGGEQADFETELAFERRVREMAQPSLR